MSIIQVGELNAMLFVTKKRYVVDCVEIITNLFVRLGYSRPMKWLKRAKINVNVPNST